MKPEEAVLQIDLLIGTECELPHDPTLKEKPFAIAYLRIPWGYRENEITCRQTGTNNIPICKECYESLHSEHWVLLACKRCSSNHWIDRRFSNHIYPCPPCIVWIDACPECT